MIYRDSKEEVSEHYNGKTITAIYRGLNLIWQAVRSCFGKGLWFNDKPWLNSDAWKN